MSEQPLHVTSSPQDFSIPGELGHVEGLLEGTEGNGAEAEEDFLQSREVEKKESGEIERLFKLVEEQQMRIDEMAAGKSFSLQDVISVAEIRLKEKAIKYKSIYVDAQNK
ncbi:hypothetical protein MKW94_020061, partial [Papaver nudicaule]|nr:hypothetical protein [Papaver nudicaule]